MFSQVLFFFHCMKRSEETMIVLHFKVVGNPLCLFHLLFQQTRKRAEGMG